MAPDGYCTKIVYNSNEGVVIIMQMPKEWNEAEMPEGGVLVRKELFEYTTEKGRFDIELFENLDGKFYAIGLPKDDDRMIIYGSNVTETKAMALSIVMDKIEREE